MLTSVYISILFVYTDDSMRFLEYNWTYLYNRKTVVLTELFFDPSSYRITTGCRLFKLYGRCVRLRTVG
jgi:hypothetical protein